MTTALVPAPASDARELALLKAVGLDKVQPEQRELALSIAAQYGLDVMLKHLVMVEGRPFITRDGLLHIAHRSGVFDGLEVTDPVLDGDFWRASATVYRKDMTRPFTYPGRYPAKGGNARFAPEMAIKVAESMALRRAFDVAAPIDVERWELEPAPEDKAPAPASLAERARQKAAAVRPEPVAAQEAHSGAEDLAAVAEAVFSDVAAQAPSRMTSEAFGAFLSEQRISPEYAKQAAASMFPGVAKLDDEQRARLAEALR